MEYPMHPKELKIQDFTYALPDNRIAAFPLPDRDASRLLVYRKGRIEESPYWDIAQYLPEDSILVFNESKVVEARLIFRKPTGGHIEVFALEPSSVYPDIQTAMSQQGIVHWQCLIGGASKWKHGMVLEKKILVGPETHLPGIPESTFENTREIIIKASIRGRESDTFQVEFNWQPEILHFAELLHLAGQIPLPPYIKRETMAEDSERYQTIYAREAGSVAAPTAGLHFTPRIFSSLSEKHIDTAFVTLHVGAGTFKPVKAGRMEGHDMHAEFMDVNVEILAKLSTEKRIYAVGTTSLRTLESLYWMGVKASRQPDCELSELEIHQWDTYEELSGARMERQEALRRLLTWMHNRKMNRLICKTQILIAPGYRVRMISGLVTNFHQPQSTLLLLVAAMIGDDWRKVYQHALDHGFRFLSYGDGCLLMVGS